MRLWSPWLAPRHGKTDLSLNEDAILCSFLDSNGKHLVFLAVGGINNVVPVFRSTPDGALTVHVGVSFYHPFLMLISLDSQRRVLRGEGYDPGFTGR